MLSRRPSGQNLLEILDSHHGFPQRIRRGGKVAARVIKGEKPGEIPIQPVSKVIKILNLKAARAQGISFPPELLKEVDEVIQ